MRTRRDDDDAGFTLIELLTVVMIISTLAAIMIPTFMGQRAKSYRAAMASDLHAIALSETAYQAGNGSYTDDTTLLAPEGYRKSNSVTAHIKLTGTTFVACTRHSGIDDWLVYDSVSGTMRSMPNDCV